MDPMEKPRCAHPWLARYCIRTLQLLPALPVRVAIQWAVGAYPYCSDTEPERAAERFVESGRKQKRGHAGSAPPQPLPDDMDAGRMPPRSVSPPARSPRSGPDGAGAATRTSG